MDYKIERVQHSSPALRVIQEQGQRIPLEKLKEKIEHHFGNGSGDPSADARHKEGRTHPSVALIDRIIQDVNEVMQGSMTHFEFKIHEKSGEVIVKLIDNETEEVVREIPSEKIVEIMANLRELVGLCVDKKI